MHTIQLKMNSEMYETMLSLWPGETSLVSPLAPFKPDLSARIQKQFQKSGWLNADGQPSPELAELLQTLAQTRMETNLLFSTAEQQKSYHLYALPEDISRLSVFTETEETVILQTPQPEDELLNELKAYVPSRQGDESPLKLEMAIADGLTLAALLDLQRLTVVLGASMKNSPVETLELPQPAPSQMDPVQGVWDEGTILKVLQRDADAETAFWVISSTLETLVDKDEWTAQDVKIALKRLSEAKLIEMLGEGKVALIGTALHLANLLAAPEKMISLTRRWVMEEHGYSDIADEEMLVICASMTNLIFLRASGGGIALCILPGDEMITAISAVLFSPPSQSQSLWQALFPLSSKPAEKIEIATNGKLVCPQCGSQVKPGKKFCWNCGAAAVTVAIATSAPLPVPIICPKCGQAIKPGKKFCGHCGNIISN